MAKKSSAKKVSGKKSTPKKETSKKKERIDDISEEKPNKEKQTKEKIVKEIVTIGEEEDDLPTDVETIASLNNSNAWWVQEPYRTLLDPELAGNLDLSHYDLSELINDFVNKMVNEEFIDFRISGLAIFSSAKLYHKKITGVIDEEEEIQKQEIRERMKRQIPHAIAQPLSETRKIATADELFGAMRRAIIETMQKREKLRVMRERREANKEVRITSKSKGKLPAEILKHITGKEDTIEERLQKRHHQLQEIISLEKLKDNKVSMEYFKKMIYSQPEMDFFGKKVSYIAAFQEFLFLASLNKVVLRQVSTHSPIDINLTDRTKVEF